MVKERLPSFDLNAYSNLLVRLSESGYTCVKTSALRELRTDLVVYLRHDVDLHLSLVLEMAYLEARLGIQSSYYVPLTLHFNLLYPPNQKILKEIVSLGHEIGLHYDLQTYPLEPDQARAHLDWEIDILSQIVGVSICTITMHQPHTGKPDPFRMLDKYIHPHDPRYQDGLMYVSDSCRAWRDENLLECFGPTPPRRLLLTTHPELWLNGTIIDRMIYLDKVLIGNALQQHQEYFDKTVRQVWLNYPATHQHDEREQRRTTVSD